MSGYRLFLSRLRFYTTDIVKELKVTRRLKVKFVLFVFQQIRRQGVTLNKLRSMRSISPSSNHLCIVDSIWS